MLKQLRDRLAYIMLQYTILELQNSVMAIIWGIWLLASASLPSDLPLNFAMRQLAPLFVWGVVFTIGGTFQLYVLLADIWSLRRWAAILSCMSWALVGALFYMATPSSTIIPVYFILSASQGWAFLRLLLEKNGEPCQKPRAPSS